MIGLTHCQGPHMEVGPKSPVSSWCRESLVVVTGRGTKFQLINYKKQKWHDRKMLNTVCYADSNYDKRAYII